MNLPDPIDASMLALPVTAQLLNAGNDRCWENVFNTARRNTTAQFKAKAP